MPGSPTRQFLRQLTSADALLELDARLQVWQDEDPLNEEPIFPPPPDALPQQSNVPRSDFDWGRYAESLERSRRRRLETQLEPTSSVRDYQASIIEHQAALRDNDPHSRESVLARERLEDQRYNAIAENIRLTHSSRQRLVASLDRIPDRDTAFIRDRFENEEYDAEYERLRQARIEREGAGFPPHVGEQRYTIPDAVDSYIADPPLPALEKGKEARTMDDMSFLTLHAEGGDATLTIKDPYTKKTTVLKDMNLTTIELIAPVLAFSFEESRNGPKYSIQDVSLTAVLCMLRHIYTMEHYVPGDCVHDQMSALLHIEIFHLASTYDISSLKTMVKARVFLELELSTSYPGPPKDLCKALAYAYEHLPNENDITKTLAHYCITCFLQHRLNEDELFTTFHYNCRPFQRDLCVILRENGFEDECAPTLIQLPVKTSDIPTRWPTVVDADPQGSFLEDEFDNEVKRRTNISQLDKLRIHFRIALPLR
ncbi:unnamed protein product [Aureobasidium uvarum]|uniref:BTB domain-containing protein n=1 Tax=Aureobasidium uvarum TaxID=2773716 RepID=A0A9N8K872_9PEZI|nr:unnamed protein product [Aureobasidium uvarum]